MATTGFAPNSVAPAQGVAPHYEADERIATLGAAGPVVFPIAFPAGCAPAVRPTAMWDVSLADDPETGDSSDDDDDLEEEDDDDFDELDDDEFDEDEEEDDFDDEFDDEDEDDEDFDELDDEDEGDEDDEPGEDGNTSQA